MKGYIELNNENGTYRITPEHMPVVLCDVVDDVIIPLLLAAGWNQKSIDDIFGGER